ncbi:MAG: hypothetical protein E6G95_01260 [Alphaproteobacteria bacterium]|nr:MAG: hypothetical protein E6G95_01260 [Alphaproteobacteria bacterium]
MKTTKSASSDSKNAAVEATTSAGGAIAPDKAAPATIASKAGARPSRRCTRSRSTSAMPIIATPDGAIIGPPCGLQGSTGTRHGPPGGQLVPMWPIIQLAAGMQAMKARK